MINILDIQSHELRLTELLMCNIIFEMYNIQF